jgi:RHS repeat-associated protein
MARTAPVPNFPAIPGMNPGLFILGGGGDGGGSGAGGGKGGGGKQGAGGNNGGKDANGGGKGAGNCGAGSGGGCPGGHDGGSVTAGDPVDVATGRVLTVPVVDARFAGALGLEFSRAYSSAARERDVGLGSGWSHSYAWSIEVRRRTVEVWQEGGQRVVFPRPEPGEGVVGPMGWLLTAEPWGFVVEADDDLKRIFAQRVEDGVLMTAVENRNGQRTNIHYEGGRLTEIQDAAGRSLRVKSGPDGRINRLEATNAEQQGRIVVLARYLYDDAGRLIRATDAAGADTCFEYDADHQLTAFTTPTGLTFHFVYDSRGRCIETWGDRAEERGLSLNADLGPFLADGRTRAQGILHTVIDHSMDGYSEVITATRVQRFFFDESGRITKASSGPSTFSRVYDALGLLTSYTDPAGNETIWKRNERGLILSYTDAAGHVTEYEHDAEGRVAKITNPEGGIVTVERDGRGNPVRVTDPASKVTAYQYDDRGLITTILRPNGSVIRIGRDRHGNIAEVVAPNGGVFRLTYDYFGRQTSITGPTGATTTTGYDDRGDVVRVVSATGGVSTFAYDAAGHPIEYVAPGGRTYKIGWAGLDQSISLTRPDGTELRLLFDYDQKLVAVRNELGELHRFQYDSAGFLAREETYDGRTLSYKFDLAGNLVAYDNGAGKRTELVRDAVGQIVGRKWADGTEDTLEYNGRGEIVRAANDRVEVLLERDPVGFVVRETQIVDGVGHAIDVRYDALGRRKERRTSLGFAERFERDVMGWVSRWTTAGDEAHLSRDLLGRELRRSLRLGGAVESAFDLDGRLVRRRALGAGAGYVASAGQPQWIGGPQEDVRMDRAYSWSAAGDLEQIWDQTDGLTRLAHDAVGRVLSVLPAKLREELFRYDAAERVYEAGEKGPSRSYGSGGRLLRRGPVRYHWDEAGRLVRKEVDGPSGSEAWTYTWDAADRLQSVTRPDGAVIDFVYDVFGRRARKTERRRELSGRDTVIATTRFVWDRQVLALEIRTSATDAGDPVIEERTYSFDDETFVPFAHHEARTVAGQREDLGTVHYATDPIGTPTHLLGPDGAVVGRIERTAWCARIATDSQRETPLRFQGQYEDAETGLYYNRHRYYDPETGNYLSADPIGLAGGHLPFGYVNNPFVGVDPLGLAQKYPASSTTITLNDGPPPTTIKGDTANFEPGFVPHPAVMEKIPPPGEGLPPAKQRGNCSEVVAMSKLLDQQGVPREGYTPEQVKAATSKIDKVETTMPRTGAGKAACGYCGKMMASLGVPPEKIVNG